MPAGGCAGEAQPTRCACHVARKQPAPPTLPHCLSAPPVLPCCCVLQPQVYLDYLRNKYSELYQIKL